MTHPARRVAIVSRMIGKIYAGYKAIQLVGTGLMARCCQHETDHLDGILFLDRLDAASRKQAMKEIRQSPWYDAANPPTVKISPHGTGR